MTMDDQHRKALHQALHSFQGAAARWAVGHNIFAVRVLYHPPVMLTNSSAQATHSPTPGRAASRAGGMGSPHPEQQATPQTISGVGPGAGLARSSAWARNCASCAWASSQQSAMPTPAATARPQSARPRPPSRPDLHRSARPRAGGAGSRWPPGPGFAHQ